MTRREFSTMKGIWQSGRVRSLPVILLGTGLQVLLIGCGGGTPGSEVGGTITYQGQPVIRGLINFAPETGRPLGGPIRPDGTYQFHLPPGHYLVTIVAPPEPPEGWKEGDPVPTAKPLVPARYAQTKSSRLRFTVPEQAGPLVKDFDLR